MRSEHQKRVDQFMLCAKQELPANLILEEAFETVRALGFVPYFIDGEGLWDYSDHEIQMDKVCLAPFETPDLIGIADGCADLSVVNTGALSACGIDDSPLLEAVDQNNMEKFGHGHSIREDGKLVKPPGHKPPDIAGVLRAQGWEG